MGRVLHAGIAGLALVLMPMLMPGQQPSDPLPSALPVPDARTAEGTITLDVIVTDKSGNPVAGLQQKDFTVLDDEHTSPILSFQEVNHSATGTYGQDQLFVILDDVNESLQYLEYARESVKQFLQQNHGQLPYPVSLAIFTEAGMQIQTQPSHDGNAMAAAINALGTPRRLMERSSGIYGSEELLRMSLDGLTSFITQERTRPGRKLVIWVSPGWPFLNAVPNSLTQNQQQRIFNSVVGYSTGLRQAQITLYSVDPQGAIDAGSTESSRYKQFVPGLESVDHAEIGDMGLQAMATQSGGRVIIGNDLLLHSINSCAAELNDYYELTIKSGRGDPKHSFHSIGVKLDRSGLTARTRTGYYPPQ